MSKARVLLADDNPAILEKAASTLASEFDVVALYTMARRYWMLLPNWILMSLSWTYQCPFWMGSRLQHV